MFSNHIVLKLENAFLLQFLLSVPFLKKACPKALGGAKQDKVLWVAAAEAQSRVLGPDQQRRMSMWGGGQGNVCMALVQCRMSQPIRQCKVSVPVGGQSVQSGMRRTSWQRNKAKQPKGFHAARCLAQVQQPGCGEEGTHSSEQVVTGSWLDTGN